MNGKLIEFSENKVLFLFPSRPRSRTPLEFLVLQVKNGCLGNISSYCFGSQDHLFISQHDSVKKVVFFYGRHHDVLANTSKE
jgi:hypothetical protein